MQAFIPSAGLGTRLRPLTDDRPKALVEVEGKTLLEINIRRVVDAGARRVVVNVHHFADKVIDFLQSKDWGVEVLVSDERNLLLDTGGGLKKAESLFIPDEPILIHNVDVLTRIDLAMLEAIHTEGDDLATLCVSHRATSRYLLFSPEQGLVGWKNTKTGEILWAEDQAVDNVPLAFSGIAMVEPEFVAQLPAPQEPYPIVPQYLRVAKEWSIGGFLHDAADWMDVGKPETLPLAAEFLAGQNR